MPLPDLLEAPTKQQDLVQDLPGQDTSRMPDGILPNTGQQLPASDQVQDTQPSVLEAFSVYGKAEKIPEPGEHNEYIPIGANAQGFSKNCQPITLECLIRREEKVEGDDSSDEDVDLSRLSTLTTSKFLWLVLLGLSRAKAETKVDFTTFKKQKRGKMQSTYKHKYLFGSLNDRSLMTCVILEKNNDEHNVHWSWHRSKHNVRVGIRLAVQNPRVIGHLPTKSVIIETKLPFIILGGPPIKPAPIIADTASHIMKYFILKEHKIKCEYDHLPVPWKTSCNADYCDRLEFKHNHNAPCGCWGMFAKNDSSARNAVLQFDFKFKANGNTNHVKNFTSLRTSRLFFKGEKIAADVDALTIHQNTRSIQEKFLKTLHFVNKSGGWTIIGWYIRGEKQGEEPKQDNEESLLSDGDLKINVAYLYPTKIKHKDIPDANLFCEEDLTVPATTGITSMATHNV